LKIPIQVFAPPYSYEDLDSPIKTAEAGLDKGHEVTIFLSADSVLSINSYVKPIRTDRDIPRKLESLVKEKALKFEICGICMDYRGVTKDIIIPGSSPSDLPELASLIFNSDRFVNLMARGADMDKMILFVVYQAPAGSIWVNERFRTEFEMCREDIKQQFFLLRRRLLLSQRKRSRNVSVSVNLYVF